MTPFIPFPNGAQAEALYVFDGKPITNRFWFLNRQPPTTAIQIENLAIGLGEWARTNVLPFLGNDIQLVGARARSWDTTPATHETVTTIGDSGGSSSRCLSANVAVRIELKGSSAQTFRNNSSFVGGIPIDVVEGNTVDAGFLDNLFEAYVDLIDLAAVFGVFPAWRWVVASSWESGSLRSTLAFARTDFILVKNNFTTQRRRRTGVVVS